MSSFVAIGSAVSEKKIFEGFYYILLISNERGQTNLPVFFQTVVSQSVSVEEKSILSLGYLQYQCTEKSIVCLHNYNSIHGNMITSEH